MWQVFSLLGLFANAFENSLDKYSLINGKSLDYAITTFYRVVVFTAILVIFGLFWYGGNLSVLVDWRIILFGLLSALYGLSYTVALKKIEVTNIGTITYIGPAVFLLIDTVLLHVPLSLLQGMGVLLLVIGGIGFSIDGVTKKLKKELSLSIFGIFIFWSAYGGIEAYLFKFMHASYGIDAPTFFSNTWAWAGISLLFLILIQRKGRMLFDGPVRIFVTRSVFSKTCDASSTLFTAQALTLASVSQVSAMEALSPLILFFVTFLIQGVLHYSLNERLDRKSFAWKAFMIVLLVAGGFMVH
ncbi:MAG: hypothetical protein JWN37_339 [Candidatus Nomurabacteria bacterium]|nr:hypothetical protein [Candidatus Nomurabacteria bacterium]